MRGVQRFRKENMCYRCNKTKFDTIKAMNTHNNDQHSNLMKLKTKVICEVCGTVFPTEAQYVEHQQADNVHEIAETAETTENDEDI